MAHVEKRVRNGRVTYRARYRDPAGREHGKVFARKVDAQRFLTEMENAKLRGRWTESIARPGAVSRLVRRVATDDHEPSAEHGGP
jgi:hypothetical protein